MFEAQIDVSVGKNYTLVDTPKKFSGMLKALSSAEVIAFDTETTGLDWKKDIVLGVSFSWEAGTGAYIPIHLSPAGERFWKNERMHNAIVEGIKNVLEDPAVGKIAQNGKFDTKFLHSNFGMRVCSQVDPVQSLYFDTMLAHHLIDENSRHKLEILAEKYVDSNAARFEDELLKHCPKGKKDKMWLVPLDVLSVYACADADYTFQLFEKFDSILESQGLADLFYEIIMPLAHILVVMEVGGIRLDTDYMTSTSKKLQDKMKQIETGIYKEVGREFNLGSPKQLQEVLYETLRLPTVGLKRTKTGFSTDMNTLNILKDKSPVAKSLVRWRKYKKLDGTYYQGILKKAVDSFIHATFNIASDTGKGGTVSGRLSSANPNMQNQPRGPLVKRGYIAQDGYTLITSDFNQLELVVIAHLSQDPEMCRIYREGGDIHSETTIEIFDLSTSIKEVKKNHPEERNLGKTVNFALAYGQETFTLSNMLGVSMDRASEIRQKFFGKYVRILPWVAEMNEILMRDLEVVNMFGRRRRLPELAIPRLGSIWGGTRKPSLPECFKYNGPVLQKDLGIDPLSDEWREGALSFSSMLGDALAGKRSGLFKCIDCKWLRHCIYEKEKGRRDSLIGHAYRQGVNALVQGTAVDLVNKSFVNIYDRARKEEIDMRPIIQVHDELGFECADDQVEEGTRIVEEEMVGIGVGLLSLPLGVDMKISKRWSGEGMDVTEASNEEIESYKSEGE